MLVNERRAIVVAAVLLAGAALMGVLVTQDWVQRIDDDVLAFALRTENRPATVLAEGMSLLGSAWVNWPLRIAAALLLLVRRRYLQFAAFAMAVLTSEVLIGTLKSAYDRPRPPGSLITTSGASFPSGHAVAGAVTAVGLVLVLAEPGPSRWRWEVRAVVFASVMALSRVYLRAHWLSDTVAGAMLGGGLALGWPALLSTLRNRRHRVEPVP
jgi:membrane-associated phospholipid phosphatase